MIIIAEIYALVFIEILKDIKVREIFGNHFDDKFAVVCKCIGLVSHIFLVFRRIFHHCVVLFHHILMVVGPVNLQCCLMFFEIYIVFNHVEKAVVDIFHIWMQIVICRNVFMLVLGDFILRIAFSFNEKRQLPDEKLVQFIDAF